MTDKKRGLGCRFTADLRVSTYIVTQHHCYFKFLWRNIIVPSPFLWRSIQENEAWFQALAAWIGSIAYSQSTLRWIWQFETSRETERLALGRGVVEPGKRERLFEYRRVQTVKKTFNTFYLKTMHEVVALLCTWWNQAFQRGWLLAFEHCIVHVRTQKHTYRQRHTTNHPSELPGWIKVNHNIQCNCRPNIYKWQLFISKEI